jgi:hypothetical protein
MGVFVNKFTCVGLVLLLTGTASAADERVPREISLDDLRDKIRGGWAGQMIGILLPTGGTADVYLDEVLSDTVDVYPDEPMAKTNESLWHRFGLEDKEHELRVVVRGETYGESQGSDISIMRLTVFR